MLRGEGALLNAGLISKRRGRRCARISLMEDVALGIFIAAAPLRLHLARINSSAFPASSRLSEQDERAVYTLYSCTHVNDRSLRRGRRSAFKPGGDHKERGQLLGHAFQRVTSAAFTSEPVCGCGSAALKRDRISEDRAVTVFRTDIVHCMPQSSVTN